MLCLVPPVDPLRSVLAAAAEGDNVAVGELVRLTQDRVLRMCHSLGSPGEAEDLAQETYLRALRSLHMYRGDAPVQTWLLSIARHVCADHVRHRQRQRRLIDRIARTTSVAATPTTQHTHDLLDLLDADRREAFVLTQLVGLSYEEAADVMSCPIGTVRSRVARARAELMAAAQQPEAM